MNRRAFIRSILSGLAFLSFPVLGWFRRKANTLTLAPPSGTEEGDLLLLFTDSPHIHPPYGWTRMSEEDGITTHYRMADGTESEFSLHVGSEATAHILRVTGA